MHPGLTKIAIYDFTEIRITEFNKIIYCKAEGNYTSIHIQNKSILVSKVLKHYESILPSDTFLRIHRSYLINISFITGLKKNKVILLNSDVAIPIARRRKSMILKELSKNYLLVR